MTKENFYIAKYQAILERDVTKVVKFGIFNNEEEKNYPNEYPKLNYAEIFKSNEPDDFLEALLKSEEYQDFYALYKQETKVLAENYILACYQAILEKNVTKVIALINLNSEEKQTYPNEYSELDYDEIFQANDPDDVLTNLLESEEYQGFSAMLGDTIFSHITEEKYLFLSKPHPIEGLYITDNLLSLIYSGVNFLAVDFNILFAE